jgi:hypothetical protein
MIIRAIKALAPLFGKEPNPFGSKVLSMSSVFCNLCLTMGTSYLVSSGLSLSIVRKLWGHTQASMTQRYAHLADKPLRQAAELFGKKVGKRNIDS